MFFLKIQGAYVPMLNSHRVRKIFIFKSQLFHGLGLAVVTLAQYGELKGYFW